MRGNSPSPGESGTRFPHVLCLSQDPRLWLIDGGDEELWDSASIHLLWDLGLAKKASTPHGSERASHQRRESNGHNRLGVKFWSNSALMTMLGGWAVHGLVSIEETWSDRDDRFPWSRKYFGAHSSEGCNLGNPISCCEGY